jgi:hypothetical protein
MLKDKFMVRCDDNAEQTYELTRVGDHFKVSWEHRLPGSGDYTHYTERSVQKLIDAGDWIVIDTLPDDFYFVRKDAKNKWLFRATLVDCWGELKTQYRVDWITQGGYPETQGYLPVEAVQRFVETEEWVVTEAPKAEGPKVFTAPLTNEDVFAYGCEVGAKVSMTRGHERELVTVDFQHDEADFSVKVYNGNQDLLVSMLNAVSAVIYARKRK